MVIDNVNTPTNSIWISKQSYCIDRDTQSGDIIDFLMESLVPISQNSSFWHFETEIDKTVKVKVPKGDYQYLLKGFSSSSPVQSQKDVSYFIVSIKNGEMLLTGHKE